MGRRLHKLLFAVLLICLLAGCSRGKVIPRSTLARIYADMFLADQWLYDHPECRAQADTQLFYEPILERYGYTFKDYDASVNHYIDDPEKFSKIFREASVILSERRAKYLTEQKRLQAAMEFNSAITGYRLRRFPNDSLLWRSPDSLLRDSMRRDSLLRDSLMRDSVRIDSLRRDSLRLDSLTRRSMTKLHKPLLRPKHAGKEIKIN